MFTTHTQRNAFVLRPKPWSAQQAAIATASRLRPIPLCCVRYAPCAPLHRARHTARTRPRACAGVHVPQGARIALTCRHGRQRRRAKHSLTAAERARRHEPRAAATQRGAAHGEGVRRLVVGVAHAAAAGRAGHASAAPRRQGSAVAPGGISPGPGCRKCQATVTVSPSGRKKLS